ncbi:putative disease resistance protein [Dorcoceras hygrometricum]|uniref:Putative disease resistance protein n=1 Tax=Dorcoceras hygrometricum TaxID=472368 RepID=A0A2Z7CAV2_9LAMI|nr:putative disease resistance protein [Dorcoceras hygrometricum]
MKFDYELGFLLEVLIVALFLVTAGSRRANTRVNEKASRIGYYTRNQQQEESAARVPYTSAGLCTCWLLLYQLVDDDESRYDVVLYALVISRWIVVSAGYSVEEERTSGEQPRVARDNYLDAGLAAGRINTS